MSNSPVCLSRHGSVLSGVSPPSRFTAYELLLLLLDAPRPPPAALVAQRLDAPLSPWRGEAGTDCNRCTRSISF
ncbi:forkhead box protein J1-B [Lates japonicus]